MRGLKPEPCNGNRNQIESHLLQMRGLKLSDGDDDQYDGVASFTDAWIETAISSLLTQNTQVASFTDAWIETSKVGNTSQKEQSHLLQMRGLKPIQVASDRVVIRRIFYRCVD